MRKSASKDLVKEAQPKPSVCDGVIEQIKGLVEVQGYRPGSRLPPERDLSEQLGVSRASLREALRTLSNIGVLETRHGSGSHVSESSTNVLKSSFEFLVLMDRPTIDELYEIRELIELHLVERAAQRRSDEDVEALKETLADLKAAIADPDAMTDADVRFHEIIASAARLAILARFMECLHDAIRSGIAATQAGVRDWVSTYEIHERICDAIIRQDSVDARRAMSIHMAMATEELKRARSDEKPQ